MEGTGLKKRDLKRFREILLTRKKEILRNAQRTLSEDMTLESDDLPDEMDLASSEYLQSFTFRLRGREKTFLQKIDHALERIEDGTFGLCEQCGEPISLKRIEARLDAIRENGGNPFNEYSLPEAIIKFKQGFGRLIRSRTDTGIVVVLDKRIVTKFYGKQFIAALPACRVVRVTA